MCYPKPGPRCSGHAKARVQRLARAHRETAEALAAPSLTARKRATLEERLKTTRKDLRRAQTEYAATPQGRDVLNKSLDAARKAGDTKQVAVLEARRNRADMISGHQRYNLERLRAIGVVPVPASTARQTPGRAVMRLDPTGVLTEEGITVGGDAQAGEPHSIRFESGDKLARTTVYSYSVAYDADGNTIDFSDTDNVHSWGNAVQTESDLYESRQDAFYHAPDRSETYYDNPEPRYTSEEEASAAAKSHLEGLRNAKIEWDYLSEDRPKVVPVRSPAAVAA